MEMIKKFGILDAMRQALQGGMIKPADEDFETQLDKMLNRETLIKVEPERIALLIVPPDGKSEKLIPLIKGSESYMNILPLIPVGFLGSLMLSLLSITA